MDKKITKPSGFKPSDEIDVAIAKELILNPTITDIELGKRIGLSRQIINKRRRAEAVQAQVKELIEVPLQDFKQLVSKSFLQIEKLLESKNESIRLKAATSILKLVSATTHEKLNADKLPKNLFDPLNSMEDWDLQFVP